VFWSERTVKTGRSTTATLVGAHRSRHSGRTGRSGAVSVLSGVARGGETPRRLGVRGGLGKARATSGRRAARTPRQRRGAFGSNVSVCLGLTAFFSKVVNRKVVDLTTLFNFFKGRTMLFSTDFAQIAAKL
jgi:hypothetical protein